MHSFVYKVVKLQIMSEKWQILPSSKSYSGKQKDTPSEHEPNLLFHHAQRNELCNTQSFTEPQKSIPTLKIKHMVTTTKYNIKYMMWSLINIMITKEQHKSFRFELCT